MKGEMELAGARDGRQTEHSGHGAQTGIRFLFVGSFDLEAGDCLEADGVYGCRGAFGGHDSGGRQY